MNRISNSPDASISHPFAVLLSQIVAEPALELEWLDLLSLLEYVGCRKILKAVPYDRIGRESLQHISEEASHAYLLKSVAEAGGLPVRSWSAARFVPTGWKYFSELDRDVSGFGGGIGAQYPAVSWAIERRVLEVYPMYAKLTSRVEVRRVLQRIMAQEARHGSQFEVVPLPEGLREHAVRVEAPLWERFQAELAASVAAWQGSSSR